MNIEKQKELAKEVLHKLEVIDPNCILAGGAPRNWYFDKEANDLDFYLHIHNETLQNTQRRFDRLGLDVHHIDYRSDAWKQYGVMEDLFRIYEGDYRGQKIQIMVMNRNTFDSVLPQFGVSICKFWWKGGKVRASVDALISVLEKTLYLKDDYSAKEVHVEKMKKYYHDYKVTNYSSFHVVKDYYIDKWLNSDIASYTRFEDYLEEVVNDNR